MKDLFSHSRYRRIRGNAALIVLIWVALIIAGPLLTIWAINTLFPIAAIPYNIWTWLAALLLGGVLKISN